MTGVLSLSLKTWRDQRQNRVWVWGTVVGRHRERTGTRNLVTSTGGAPDRTSETESYLRIPFVRVLVLLGRTREGGPRDDTTSLV